MPLTELQFDLRTLGDPVELLARVQKFLADNREFAYSADEVAGELGLEADTSSAVLTELALLRTIEGRDFKEGLYFRYVRDLTQGDLNLLTAV